MSPEPLWHVTAAVNRDSVRLHGLDWRRMSNAPGIAGSRGPEQQGSFLCLDEFEVAWFVRMNNTGGPVDVWEVLDVDPGQLVESPEGHHFLPEVIPPDRLRLVQRDLPPEHG